MEDIALFSFPVRTHYTEKSWFTSHRPKYSHSIRLQDSLIINITGSNASVTFFTRRYPQRKGNIVATTFGCMSPAMPSHAQPCLDFPEVSLWLRTKD